MAPSFAVPDEPTAQLLRLVAAYSGVSGVDISTNGSLSDFEISAADRCKGFGAHNSCKFIACMSPASAQLLGEGAEQQAKVQLLAARCMQAAACRRR